MDARVFSRMERAIREAYAAYCGAHDDWMPIKEVAAALPGVSLAAVTHVLTELQRRDEVVLASNPARASLTSADHEWAINGRHLLHVRPATDGR